ncbi:hypothetical protein HN51_067733, partial [Arachis hypogaea]
MAVITTTRRTERFRRTTPPTCKYWLAGRCNRNPCRFSYSLPTSPSNVYYKANTTYKHSKKSDLPLEKMASSSAKKAINCAPKAFKKPEICALKAVECRPEAISIEKPSKCEQKAVLIEKTADVEDVATVAKASAITGIALAAGSDKLISGSTDGTVRTWDCNTGRCVNMIHLNSEVTSLISEGPWIFARVKNAVKAWNIQMGADVTLDGPKGQVLSLNVGNDILLAGAEDGVIYAWRCSFESPFKMVTTLSGYSKPVVCLAIGCHKMLYSGSMDHSIKVWDLDTLQCTITLNGHTDVVTSLICWDNYLLS